MRRISKKTERALRVLLRDGWMLAHAARRVGCSPPAAKNVKEMLDTVDRIDADTHRKIHDMLKLGSPVDEVASLIVVPRQVVRSVARFHYLDNHPRNKGAERCAKCKQIIPAVHAPYNTKRVPVPEDSLAEHKQELYRIAEDIVGLDSLQLITNYLFRKLAKQTRDLLTRIRVGE